MLRFGITTVAKKCLWCKKTWDATSYLKMEIKIMIITPFDIDDDKLL